MRLFGHNLEGDRGGSMVEYGLIAALIAVMSLSAVTLLGEETEATFTALATELEGSDNGSVEQDGSGFEDDGEDPGDNDQGDDNGGNDAADNGDDDDAGNSGDDDNGDDAGDSDDNDNGDDAGNSGDDDNGDDAGNNGDDDANSGGSGEDDGDETSAPASNPTETLSAFYWWNETKHGGYGAWTASVGYHNDTSRHQYLNLEITRVDEKGRESVGQYDGFYVPANGEATYTHWSNNLEDKNGKLSGTVKVKVKVLSMETSDENWQPVSFDIDEDPVTVAAPPTG